MRRDDPFSGGVARRLLRIDRELAAAVRDAQCRDWVADRPDRYEPRRKKRRKDHYGWLNKPRAELKRQMAKGVGKK